MAQLQVRSLLQAVHDAMKADDVYQRAAPQATIAFPAGGSWACFSDQVSHAVLSGPHQFEQTLLLAPEALLQPDQAPQRILEELAGRPLTARRLRLAA